MRSANFFSPPGGFTLGIRMSSARSWAVRWPKSGETDAPDAPEGPGAKMEKIIASAAESRQLGRNFFVMGGLLFSPRKEKKRAPKGPGSR
jgi:hypothetical protein